MHFKEAENTPVLWRLRPLGDVKDMRVRGRHSRPMSLKETKDIECIRALVKTKTVGNILNVTKLYTVEHSQYCNLQELPSRRDLPDLETQSTFLVWLKFHVLEFLTWVLRVIALARKVLKQDIFNSAAIHVDNASLRQDWGTIRRCLTKAALRRCFTKAGLRDDASLKPNAMPH